MTSRIPKVVFDCNLFVQVLLNPSGVASRCKQLVDNGEVTLFISAQILTEVSEVLRRPRFRLISSHFTTERIEAFLNDIVEKAIPLRNVPEEYRYVRDPKDEPYINLALVARAEYLVSYDKDLLDLMKETTDEGREFRRRYPMLSILAPSAFLQEMTGG